MRILIVMAWIVAISCNRSQVPKEVLPPAQMSSILYDIIRSDEMVDFYTIQDTSFKKFSKRTALYDSIFRMHAVSKESFKKSMKFYQTRPDIFKEVLESLQKKASDTTTRRRLKKITKKVDSIQ